MTRRKKLGVWLLLGAPPAMIYVALVLLMPRLLLFFPLMIVYVIAIRWALYDEKQSRHHE